MAETWETPVPPAAPPAAAEEQRYSDLLGAPASEAMNLADALAGRSINLQELAEEFTDEPGWVIPGLLPEEARFVLLTGPSKVGKTWIAHSLVLALGNGEPFLGLMPLSHRAWTGQHDFLGREVLEEVEGVGEPQRTLYLQAENSRWSMEHRTRALLAGQGARFVLERGEPVIDGPGAGNVTLVLDPGLDLTRGADIDALTVLVAREGYRNVVLDSAYAFLPGSLNDEELAKRLVSNLKTLHARTGCRVIAIHHASTKGEGGWRGGRESMGSTFFTSAWYDLELRVWADKDGVQKIQPITRDRAAPDTLAVRMVEAGRWERVTEAGNALEVAKAVADLRTWMAENEVEVVKGANDSYRFTKRRAQKDVAKELGIDPKTLKTAMRWVLEGVEPGEDDLG